MSKEWKIVQHTKRLPKLNTPTFIEGLPGIGSVAKIVVDFIIEDIKAKKLFSFSSSAFPPSVFVNERNLVEMPSIELYYKKTRKGDFLFLSGDLQPVTDRGIYTLSEEILEILTNFSAKKIITLGGVALSNIPKNPNIYCTGNDARFVKSFCAGTNINSKPYGTIGPIIGMSGLLLGMAKARGIPAITLLVETYAHPMYLGVNGSREVLDILGTKLGITLNKKSFEREIALIQQDSQEDKGDKPTKLNGVLSKKINYIG